jgi:hypothetical protein
MLMPTQQLANCIDAVSTASQRIEELEAAILEHHIRVTAGFAVERIGALPIPEPVSLLELRRQAADRALFKVL